MAENTNAEHPIKLTDRSPIGEAERLNKLVSKEWGDHQLLFSQMKNEVLEVNPAFEGKLPFKLEKGKSSPLGLFVEASFDRFGKKPEKPSEGKQILEFWPGHNRSIIFARTFLEDKDGMIYRDIDLKGIGHIDDFARVKRPGGVRKEEGRFGLLDKDTALYDYQLTEKLLKEGIRTNRIVGIIQLKEFMVDAEKLSVEEARRRGIINGDFNPVVEVRAFRDKLRISNLDRSNPESRIMIDDAKKIVSQELGLEKILSDQEYVKWFAETLGKTIGLMHKNGRLHSYPLMHTTHNITLDCRIVDVNAISESDRPEELSEDQNSARTALSILARAFGPEITSGILNYFELFNHNYDSVFSEKERADYFKKLN